jgi:hypothetical protein
MLMVRRKEGQGAESEGKIKKWWGAIDLYRNYAGNLKRQGKKSQP